MHHPDPIGKEVQAGRKTLWEVEDKHLEAQGPILSTKFGRISVYFQVQRFVIDFDQR